MASNNNTNQPIVNKNPQNPTTPSLLPSTFTGSFPGSGPGTIRPPGQTGSLNPSQSGYPQISGGDPRGASSQFINTTVGNFNSKLDPLINQGAYNQSNANATDAATRSQINQGYYNLGNPSGANTGGVGGGNTGSLNQRLPGESSYDWAKRAAITTGRTDIANDPGALQYWANSINSKPQSADMGYWTDKFTGGGGGGGIGGSFGNYSAFTVNPGSYNAAQAALMQAGPAAQAGTQYAGTQYSTAPRSLDMTNIGNVTPSDPFNSYKGYQDFSQTGGFTPQNLADIRARGIAPIRAAYDAAARNVAQQRSLQGGYAPNAIAAQAKMAREQGQGMADASQNVEAGIANQVQQGRLSGLGGMSNIENTRLGAQMQGDIFNAGQRLQGQEFDIGNELQNSQFNAGQGNQVGMFNAGQGNQVGMFNTGQENDISKFNVNEGNQVGMFNTGQQNAASQFNTDLGFRGDVFNAGAYQQAQTNDINDRFKALEGQRALYGTTPAMSNMFGDQLQGLLNTSGNFNSNAMSAFNQAQGQQGQFNQDIGRINAIGGLINQGAQAANQIFRDPNTGQVVGQPGGYPGVQGGTPPTLSELYPPTQFDPSQYPGRQGMPSLPAPTQFNPYQFPTTTPQQGIPNQQYIDPFQNANSQQFLGGSQQGFPYPPYQQNNLSRYGYGGNALG